MKYDAWKPVASQCTSDAFTCEVTGRKYVFDKSIFPTSVFVGDEDILYSPISINAMFGDIKGEWEKQQVILLEKNEEKAVYAVTQTCENIIVNADITVEFDGFVKVDFRIMNFWSFHKDKAARLTGFSIDIPIKNKYSSLMHFWPNCESGVCLSGKVLNSYATPNGESAFPFKPYLWAGWEYGGLGICCESDKNFELDNPDKCMTVTKYDEYTNLHISLLDRTPEDWQGRIDEWGNTLRPITYSIGIQATPVKEFPRNNLKEFRAFHLYNVPKFPIFEKVKGNGDTLLEKIASHGINWLILHEDWTVVQNYGLPENEEQFKTFVKDCHDLGIKVMVYFGYEVSSLYPGFNDCCDEYLNKNIKGNFVGGWQRPPMQRDFTVCYGGDYSDVMIDRVKHVMDDYGVDGIYTDGTYVPWECANEAHGCGYRDKNGELHFVYPIYAVREHVKKMYAAVHERGGIIDTHQSSCCMMPTLAFADSYFDGENIQPMLREDMANLKLDSFRTEFMGENMGISCNFISYTNSGFSIRLIAGISLLHNVYPRANVYDDLAFSKKIWDIYDEFGVADATWHPYWEQNEITAQDKVHISYYTNDKNETLLLITCLDKNASNAEVRLDREYSEIYDLLDNKECVLDGKCASIPVDYCNIKICKLR